MHVKDLAARYEAAVVSSAPPLPLRRASTDATSLPSARVRELRDRLEAAVQKARGDEDVVPTRSETKEKIRHSAPASRSSTLSSAAADSDLPRELQKKEGNEFSDSPRAIEAGDFPTAPLLNAVPQSVAAARDIWVGKDIVQTARLERQESPTVSSEVGKEAELGAVSRHKENRDYHEQLAALTDDATLVVSSSESNLTGDNSDTQSLGLSDDFSSAYSSESMGLIQPPEDVSDVDDLDNIDGAERVDDFDSQDGESDGDEAGNTFRRVQTVKELEDDPLPMLQAEFSGSDDGFRAAAHVDDHGGHGSGAECPHDKCDGHENGFDEDSPDHEAVTSVEDDIDDDGNDVDSAASDFARSALKGLASRISSRRPRPRSTDDGSLPSTVASGDVLRMSSKAGSAKNASLHSMERPNNASLKRLPKAKVVIARRRGHSVNLDVRNDDGPQSFPLSRKTTSMDEPGVRRLVREYSNPRELLEGHISMVDLDSDNGSQSGGEEEPAPATAVLPSKFPVGRRPRENEFKNRYDEFLDAEGLQRPLRSSDGEDAHLDVDARFVKARNSKQRYKIRLFGGKGVSKADRERQRTGRHEGHVENVQRRSAMLSGALDRVSMAADPWIDFITDTNALPGVGKRRRPFRNAMKRLFRRGKQPDLIMDSESKAFV